MYELSRAVGSRAHGCEPFHAQVVHIYAWVRARTGFEPSFRVVFYPAEYFRRMLGIFPIGDPTKYIPDDEVRTKSLYSELSMTLTSQGAVASLL